MDISLTYLLSAIFPRFHIKRTPFFTYTLLLPLYILQSQLQVGNEFIYCSLSCLILLASPGGLDRGSLREAQAHLDHAKILDPDNTIIETFTDKVRSNS